MDWNGLIEAVAGVSNKWVAYQSQRLRDHYSRLKRCFGTFEALVSGSCAPKVTCSWGSRCKEACLPASFWQLSLETPSRAACKALADAQSVHAPHAVRADRLHDRLGEAGGLVQCCRHHVASRESWL